MKLVLTILGMATVLSAQKVETPARTYLGRSLVEAPEGIYLRRSLIERANCPGPGFPVYQHLVGGFGLDGKIVTDLYFEVDPCERQQWAIFCPRQEKLVVPLSTLTSAGSPIALDIERRACPPSAVVRLKLPSSFQRNEKPLTSPGNSPPIADH